jgi:hypothetical protein
MDEGTDGRMDEKLHFIPTSFIIDVSKPERFTFAAIQLLLHSLQERACSFATPTPFPPSPRT